MIICVGAVALVVDAGVFFVTQRQMQTAADAAALAAANYLPVCQSVDPNCDTRPPVPLPTLGWTPTDCPNTHADCAADAVAVANLGYAGKLCLNMRPDPGPRVSSGNGMTFYIMTLNCDAPYWFARIFPAIPAVLHIKVHAVSTWGWRTATGDAGPPNQAVQPPPTPPTSPYVIRILE
jgi:hypothetical protein